MPTRPRLGRKTRRKDRMPSKALLLMRLLVSGLGLEPRLLLNRLQIEIILVIIKNKILPFRCWERIKKELSLWKQARWRKRDQWLLEDAGKRSGYGLLKKQVSFSFAFHRRIIMFLQRLGSCPSAPFLPWWSTQSSPFSSTTGTIDFHSFTCHIPYSKRKGKVKTL